MAVLALDESSSSVIGPITLGEKCAGKRSAGNPHAAFDEAGTGNGATSATAPVLDPTDERGQETGSWLGLRHRRCSESCRAQRLPST